MSIVQTYVNIYYQFYDIIEKNHIEAVKSLLEEPIRLKDIHLVFKVHALEKIDENFSSKIADATHKSHSIFSNYLKYAEKMRLIKRYRDPKSYKNMRVELDTYGEAVYTHMITYYRSLYTYFSKELSKRELATLVQSVYIISNALSKETPEFKTSVFNMPKSLESLVEAFDRIFFAIHEHENMFIEQYQLDLSILDLKVLSILKILELTGNNQPKNVSSMTHIHFSTISSMFKTLVKKGYLERQLDSEDRRKINASLTQVVSPIIDDYMTLRIDIVTQIESLLTKKAYATLTHAFDLLKSFTEMYVTTFKH